MQMHAPNMTRPVGPSIAMIPGQGMDPRQRIMLQQQQQHHQQQQQQHRTQPMLQARPPPPPPSHTYPPLPEAQASSRPPSSPNAEPTFEDIRNMTTIDMAVARYRAKHGYMNEIFDPRSVASIEASSKASVKTVDLPTLEAQAKRLEQANETLEKTNAERLQRAKERFAALKRGEHVSLNENEDEEVQAEAGNEKRDIVMG